MIQPSGLSIPGQTPRAKGGLWFLLICLLAISLEVFMLVTEVPFLSRWLGTVEGIPTTELLGHVERVTGVVRVQSPWDLAWRRIRESEPKATPESIYDSQSLLTAEGAQVLLSLDAGTDALIGENSMVQIRKQPSWNGTGFVFSLRVLSGSVHVLEKPRGSTKAPALVPVVVDQAEASSGSEVPLPSPVQGKSVGTQAPEIRILALPRTMAQPRPQAKPPPPPPPSGTFKPEFIKKIPPRPHSLREMPNVRRWARWMGNLWALCIGDARAASVVADEVSASAESSWSIRLRWRPVDGAARYRLQISRTPTFEVLDQDLVLSKPSYDWSFTPGMEGGDGRSYYRIASVGSEGETGGFSEAQAVEFPDEVIRRVEAKRAEWKWSGSAALHTGVSNQAQFNTDVNFAAIRTQSVYLQQRLATHIQRANDRHVWSGFFNYTAAGFHKPSTTQTTLQPDVFAYTAEVGILYARRATAFAQEIAFGIAGTRDYRWVKQGPQTVLPEGALSFGPAARLVRTYEWGEWESTLSVPLIGGALGFWGRTGAEWHPRTNSWPKWLSIRADLEGRLMFWNAPTGSRFWSWCFSVAPVFVWGSSAARERTL